MKKFDFIIVLFVLLASLLILGLGPKTDKFDVLIYVNGELYEKIGYSSDLNLQKEIVSNFGRNVVEIDSNGIRVTSSSCKDKLEVNAGYINKSGQSLICLPNRLVIELKSNGGYDAVTY